ncbi:MAG TPA: ATP-binding cassette domain-containing protein [Planctomycetota bacterium]
MSLPVAVTDLCLQRPGFQLGPLSFDVPAGGRLAIVGPSGSGKTTLLRCLAGLERRHSGRIRIGAQVVADDDTNVPPDRRQIGLVFQDGALWSHLTALQHLLFAAPGVSREQAIALLQRAGIAGQADKKPGTLSGGEAQRLGLVRALAPSPAVLLLDEPLRSVDVHQRDALVLLLRTLTDERGLTTILVTHDRDEALALATDLVVLHEGQLVEQGPALQLLRSPQTAFTAAFLLGAACLPTDTAAAGRVTTPFGTFERPNGHAGDLRLVLLPGDVVASAVPQQARSTPRGRVLAAIPGSDGFRLRVAFGDHLVQALSATALPVGSEASLSLAHPVRLLPWSNGAAKPPAPGGPA